MLFNLLTESASDTGANTGSDWWIWIILLAFMALLIIYNYRSNKKRREQAEEEKEKRNAIRPGFKVTTIGGILGTVVEVDDEANTFVLETGSEDKPSYIKFDKVAIYSSEDPNAEKQVTSSEGSTVENEVTEQSAEGNDAVEEAVDGNEEKAE